MQTFSREELEEIAAPEFERHQVHEFHATTDGQLFFKESFARAHAGKDGTVYHLTDGTLPVAEAEADAPKPMSVKELTALADSLGDVDTLNGLLEAEQTGANRKTAIQAIEARIAKLNA